MIIGDGFSQSLLDLIVSDPDLLHQTRAWIAGERHDPPAALAEHDRHLVGRALVHAVRLEWALIASAPEQSPPPSRPSYASISSNQQLVKKKITPTPVTTPDRLVTNVFQPASEPDLSRLRSPPSCNVRDQIKSQSASAWAVLTQQSRVASDHRVLGALPMGKRPPEHDERVGRVAQLIIATVLAQIMPHILAQIRLFIDMLMVRERHVFNADSRVVQTSSDCVRLSSQVLDGFVPILLNCGESLPSLLRSCPRVREHCPTLALALDSAAPIAYCTNDFSEDDRLGLDDPFRPSLDSRHLFKSPDQQRLFTNREQTRDLFMSCLLDGQASGFKHGSDSFPNEIHRILDFCVPANYSWLSGLFVSHLLLHSWNDQSWLPGPVRILAKDPVRLKKLERLSRRAAPSTAPPSNSSSRHPSLSGTSIASRSMETMFTGAESFFFRFLQETDRYRFAFFVIQRLVVKITELSSSFDCRTARIVKLMILGKFLGMLVFWPYCALDDLGSPGAITEAAAIADHSSAQIDLNRILDDALADGRLDRILTQVPWICEMVKMAPASVAQTAYFNRTVSLLTSIPRSFSSASTTCISVCIEQLCAVWRVDLSSTPSKIDLHNQRISQQDRVDRVLFTASGHLEQVLGVLRLSTAESGRWQRQNEQQRTITPSLSTLHPPVEIASALPSMVSVLRKDFFSSNPEIASLLPMIIDRIVPDVVSLSVGSVCRSSIATALSNEDRADIDMMQLSLDDADSEYVPEKVIEDAKVKCQRLCLDQCRLRVVPALEALAPRSGRPDSDALIVNQTIDLAMEHAANMIHEQISKRFPEVFKSVWEPMIKKRRRAALSSPKPTRSHPILSQSNAVPDLSDICDFLGRVDPIAAVDDSVDGRDLWTIVFLELTHKLSPSMAICCCVCQDQPCSCQSSICPLARSAFDSMTNGLRSMEVASLRGVIRSILSDCGGGKCCSSWPYVLAGLAIQVPSSRLIVESLLVNSSVISATDSEKVEFVRCFHKGCRIDHHPLQFLRLIANSTQSPSSVIADLFHIPTV